MSVRSTPSLTALFSIGVVMAILPGCHGSSQPPKGAPTEQTVSFAPSSAAAAPPSIAAASPPAASGRPAAKLTTSGPALTISPAASRTAQSDEDWVQMVPTTMGASADGDCDRPTLEKQVPSLDGGYVDQQVCHWVVSGDIIQVRLSDGRRTEVTPGNSLAVIRDGPYRGYLLVAKHKYRPQMNGSYDAVYVIRPDRHEQLEVPGSQDDDHAAEGWLTQHGWHAS